MLLNKKYKCPVCFEECITLRDRLEFDSIILCNNCNTTLSYTRSSHNKSYIPFVFFMLAWPFFEPITLQLTINFMGVVGIFTYLIFFGELEEYIPEEPAYNFNEFLDNLRSPNSNK